ncbi:MAG: T9SS type A sorting domain-containing protein [Chitinophagales bacterium]|nr:T9SS type A sorting domain-containing protein [Chitinophagales bacterium]
MIDNRLTDIKFSLDGNNADALFVFNMLYSTYDYDSKELSFAKDLKLNIKYVELGNEIYLGGHNKTWCTYPNATDYLNAANEYLDKLHADPDFTNVHVSVVAASSGIEDGDMAGVDLNTDGKDCRENTWNALLDLPKKGTQTGRLHLNSGDALSFHNYPTDNIQNTFPLVSDLPAILSQPFESVTKYFRSNSIKVIPSGVEAWITEYNMKSSHDVPGSWAHGLFMAALTLQYLEFEPISHVYAQTMAQDAPQGSFFTDINGFNYSDRFSGITTFAWQLTATGNCLKLIGEALKDNALASKLTFNSQSFISNTTDPTLYGWNFSNSGNSLEQSIILNLGSAGQWIRPFDLGWTGSAGYEQISLPQSIPGQASQDYLNPICYILGNDDVSYFWQTTTSQHISGTEAGNSKKGDGAFPILNHIYPKKFSSNLTDLVFVYLPPYSVTRLYKIATQLTLNCNVPNNPCDHQILSQLGSPVKGTTANLSVSGASTYDWKINGTNTPGSTESFLSSYTGNNVTFIPQTTSTANVTVTGDGDPNKVQTCTIHVNTPPGVSVSPTSGTYNLSNGQGKKLQASGPSNTSFWWSPTLGLYDNITAGNSTIEGDKVYARPNEYTTYLTAEDGDDYKHIFIYPYMQYTLTGIDGSGCFSLATSNISRSDDEILDPEYDSGMDYFCSGNPIIVTAHSPLNSNPVYTWFNVNGDKIQLASGTSNTLNLGASDANYPSDSMILLVEITDDQNVTVRSTVPIRIYPRVSIVPPPELTVCEGDKADLHAIAADHKNGQFDGDYKWYKGSTVIIGATQNVLNNITPSSDDVNGEITYKCKVTSANLCSGSTNEASITFTVNGSAPTVSFEDQGGDHISILSGECAQIKLTAGSNEYYEWTPGVYLQDLTGTSVITESLINPDCSAEGTDPYEYELYINSVKITSNNENGCCAQTPVYVEVSCHTWCADCTEETYTSPLGLPFSFSKLLTAEQLTDYTLQWQKNGVDISGATGSSYTVTYPGYPLATDTFRCKYYNQDLNCTFYSEKEFFTYTNGDFGHEDFKVSNSGYAHISDNHKYDVTVFPNPTSESFNVTIKKTAGDISDGGATLQLFDPFGRLLTVATQSMSNYLSAIISMDKNLMCGNYLLRVILNDDVIVKTIVKTK